MRKTILMLLLLIVVIMVISSCIAAQFMAQNNKKSPKKIIKDLVYLMENYKIEKVEIDYTSWFVHTYPPISGTKVLYHDNSDYTTTIIYRKETFYHFDDFMNELKKCKLEKCEAVFFDCRIKLSFYDENGIVCVLGVDPGGMMIIDENAYYAGFKVIISIFPLLPKQANDELYSYFTCAWIQRTGDMLKVNQEIQNK